MLLGVFQKFNIIQNWERQKTNSCDMNFADFFKDRVTHFEDERKFFADYVALILPDKQECHNLGWENRKLEDASFSAKVASDKLDLELSKIQTQITTVKADIATMRAAKESRLQQIARLSSLPQPIEHDTTYIIPEKFNTSLSSTSKMTQRKYDPLKNNNPYKLPRTGEITKLENRLNEETIRTSSYLQDLHVTLRSAEDEQFRVHNHKNEEAEQLYAKAKELLEVEDKYDIQCFLAVSELLKLRLRILVAQREEVEEVHRLQVDKQYFADKEDNTREQVRIHHTSVIWTLFAAFYMPRMICVVTNCVSHVYF